MNGVRNKKNMIKIVKQNRKLNESCVFWAIE